jgi:Spy/CpxP family protein refolding chaperone
MVKWAVSAAVALIVTAVSAAVPGAAPAAWAQSAQASPSTGGDQPCGKPAAPRYPRDGQQLTLEQLDWTRAQRDRFLAASSGYLTCLDREIEGRMRRMAETNTDDPRVNSFGAEHQAASEAVGEAIKRFALLCYDYEGRVGAAYGPGCLPSMRQ